jgi:polysaccharide deacetylase family protein (PEP-CTERM system associated)
MTETAASALRNGMSVDVEDYFQVQALEARIDRADWDRLPRRVERNTDRVLQLFADHGVRATFFTLGWVAERHPALIRRIVEQGHELASHGCSHVRADAQDESGFRADVRRSKRTLEDIGGVAVRGYRAASFSIGARNLWAFPVLAQEGYRYSSSIYPVRHDLYGMPSAPRFAFRMAELDGFTELPITTMAWAGRKLPCGGGGYFRLLPYALSRHMLRAVNRADGKPCTFYFHPWEIDPEQPRQRGLGWRARVRHYTNLGVMEAKLRCLLRDFAWDRLDRVHGLA